MVQALNEALREEMLRDKNVILIGEDIGVEKGWGGAFGVTKGLSEEFGHDRVRDTPISESAIVGVAIGAAMLDMRPVAEMQYGDFIFCAMDQVVNQAAKMRYMSGGQVKIPIVIRIPTGASGRGAQHAGRGFERPRRDGQKAPQGHYPEVQRRARWHQHDRRCRRGGKRHDRRSV